MIRKLLALAALCLATPAVAAAPPTCGSTVVLTGDQGDWRSPPLRCTDASPVTYDASAATFRSVRVFGTQGIVLQGGRVDALDTTVSAVTVDSSRWVRITGMTINAPVNAMNLIRGSDYRADHNMLSGMAGDGVDVTQAQRVSVTDNEIGPFRSVGTIHRDGLQAYSLAGQPAVTDLTVARNFIHGDAQGIDDFGDTVGTTNVVIEDNVVVVAFWHGITLNNSKGAVVRRNSVVTAPGATQGGQTVRTWLSIGAGSTGAKACGNTVSAFPSGAGTGAC